jgi:NAD(P)H-nitrite reductase large subunit
MKPKLVVVGNGMVSRRALRTLLAALADDRPWMARLGCRPWMDLCDET